MLKVGVILGGKSIEREVSFNSGRTICDHLDPHLFSVIPIFQTARGELYILPWSFLYRGKIADFEHRLPQEAQKIVWDDLPSLIDFMYVALHGKHGEDGRLQAMLELLAIPYLGSKVFGSSLGMNKVLHNHFLKLHHVQTPHGFDVTAEQVVSDFALIQQKFKQCNLSFPVVVKPQHEGSSLGVFVVHDEHKLQQALHTACFISGSIGQGVLIEEKVEGMEFTCIILTDYMTGKLFALPPTEILLKPGSEIFDYEQKYMPGAAHERTPASCSADDIALIQQTCMQAMMALEFSNMARIDGFLTSDKRVIIIDSNPLSGMGPATFLFRQAAEIGMSHGKLINHLIKTELKNYQIQTVQEKKQSMMQKKRVAVLMGGPSNEKETSFNSGRNVCYKLSTEKYEVIPVFMDSAMKLFKMDNRLLVHTSTREVQEDINQAQPLLWSDLKQQADFVFIALHGGPGENGTVQGTLEMLDMPYNGPSVFASALCMDKYKTTQFLRAHGFEVPQSMLLAKQDFAATKGMDPQVKPEDDELQKFVQKVGFPCIVKPHDDGCSVMVSSPKDMDELHVFLEQIFQTKPYALIEERIFGMELTVGVIGNAHPRSLVPSESLAKHGILSSEEKFLPGAGENQTPARLEAHDIALVQKTIRDVFVALTCTGYSRIDCFFQNEQQSPTGKKRVVILECNTLPALTPATCLFHQAAEEHIKPMQLLDEIIELGFQAHQRDEVVSIDQILEQQKLV